MFPNLPEEIIYVGIGGGTGLEVLAKGMVAKGVMPVLGITTMDDGGSSGKMKYIYGGPGISDLGRPLLAMSGTSDEFKKHLFGARLFGYGEMLGIRLSNILFQVRSEWSGSYVDAITWLHRYMEVESGLAIPTTLETAHIHAETELGHRIDTEHRIDTMHHLLKNGDDFIKQISVYGPDGKVDAYPLLLDALRNAKKYIILGPGDVYTSVLCNLCLNGVAEAIDESKAQILYVMPLMTKFGHTHHVGMKGHLQIVNSYLGVKKVSVCLVNSNTDYPPEAVGIYRDQERAEPVRDNFVSETYMDAKIVRYPMYRSGEMHTDKQVGDEVFRGPIRHDPEFLMEAIESQ